MIPMVDLKRQYAQLADEITAVLQPVLAEGQYILGPQVAAFEHEAAQFLSAPYAVACASGTDALHLALLAAGIKPNDEVITSAFTFIATAEAICYVGATPVFVDIDPVSFTLDPQAVERAITSKTRALLPVHLFGHPADLPALMSLAAHHRLAVIEDCAQSFGARLHKQATGTFGDFGAFSFFPSKNLGAFGDGGLITTSSQDAAEHLRILRNHGSRQRYQHEVIGFNSRLDEIQAAILRIKLKHLDAFNRQRQRVAQRYREYLDTPGLTLPQVKEDCQHVFHQYTILTEAREAIMRRLAQAAIACAIYYPIPLHRQPVFTGLGQGISLSVTEWVAERCLSLPIFPELTDAEIARIATVINETGRG